ncbi:MAG: CPBP family intramembrane metalloprotease [Lachnospiraceae bacterium]|nr:CPBP family intramembrane metalloprotease [Lachnospiraceae bacterium]
MQLLIDIIPFLLSLVIQLACRALNLHFFPTFLNIGILTLLFLPEESISLSNHKRVSLPLITSIVTCAYSLQIIISNLLSTIFTYFPYLLTYYRGNISSEKYGLVMNVLNLCFLSPLYEELLFREIIMRRLNCHYHTMCVILFQAFLFSIFHVNPIQIVYTFFIGLILGLIKECTSSTNYCVLFHVIFNTSSLVVTSNFHFYAFPLFIVSAFLFWKYKDS